MSKSNLNWPVIEISMNKNITSNINKCSYEITLCYSYRKIRDRGEKEQQKKVL